LRVPTIAALGFLLAAETARAVDVTECGQVIAAGQTGVLRQNLTCGNRPTWPFSPEGVRLAPGAKLDLDGFSIEGNGSGVGVYCEGGRRACTIKGPGEVRAFYAGVNCGGCRIVARDATFSDNVNGIYAPLSGTLQAKRVVASDNTEMGIWTHRLRVVDVEANRNGLSGVTGNESLSLRGVEAVDNGDEGVRCLGFECGKTEIANSTITGNDAAGDGYDIASTGRVKLRNVTCSRSALLFYPFWEENDYDTVEVIGSFGCADD